MDCQTVRRYLDCLQEDSLSAAAGLPEQPELREAVLEHLQNCPACRDAIAEHREFDGQLRQRLRAVALPEGLESRLLHALDAQISETAARRSSIRTRLYRWRATLSAAVLLLAALGVWGLRQPSEDLLDFGGAGQKLMSRFLRGDLSWQELDSFDEGFDLGDLSDELSQFRLSPAHGIDLGGGRGQDAAVFRFGLKNWEGILTVLPCQHFTGLPDPASPSVLAGRSVLQWRSSDGRLTYILFVHRGSAADLASELFGRLT